MPVNLTMDPISAGASAVSGAIGAVTNAIQARKNRQWQEHMTNVQNQFNAQQAELQRNWEFDMWNLENAYNTPAAQMNRMLEAGINPNSAVQTITNAAANVGSGSAASAASVPQPVNYNTGQLLADTLNGTMNNMLQLEQARKVRTERDWIDQEKFATISNIEAATKKLQSETSLNSQEWTWLQQLNPLYVDKTAAEIKQINAAASLAAQQVEESKKKVENIGADTELKKSEKTGVDLDNAVKQVKKQLANYGIICDSDGLTNLISIMLNDNGGEFVSKFTSALGETMEEVTRNSIPRLVESAKESTKQFGKWVNQQLHDFKPWLTKKWQDYVLSKLPRFDSKRDDPLYQAKHNLAK